MKRPAIFFDRDNTLIANDGYLGDPAKVVLISGAAQAIARARSLGFAVVTVSNQSGVGRGMFTEEAVHLVNSRMDEMLLDQHPNARIDRHEFCPYHPDAAVERYKRESDLRKPKPGMILQAADRLNLDLSHSWVVGDAPRDIEAGKAGGCRTILFADASLAASPAAEETPAVEADFHVTSLKEALDIIEQNKMNNAKTPVAEPKDETAPVVGVEVPAGEPNPSAAEAAGPATALAVETPALAEKEETPVLAEKEKVPVVADREEIPVTAEKELSAPKAAGASKAKPASVSAQAAAPAPAVAHSPEPPRRLTFAERVKAGTFQPARSATAPGPATAERPKRAVAAHDPATAAPAGAAPAVVATTAKPPAHAAAAAAEPGMRPTEPIGDSELLEPLLQQILEEVRLMRQQHHPGTEFAVTKLLAGIVQVLVLPALFFAYLHRDAATDLQSLLVLATFLQTLTISLLIMGRQQ